MIIRVTKEFGFEMAHALTDHDGPCRNIHGHSYKLFVTLKGKPVDEKNNPKNGMVIDFTDIKKTVRDEIISVYDHALVLDKNTPPLVYAGLTNQKLILTGFQPTCENLLIHFAEKLKQAFPENILLHHLLLRETSTSFAEWYADDNS